MTGCSEATASTVTFVLASDAFGVGGGAAVGDGVLLSRAGESRVRVSSPMIVRRNGSSAPTIATSPGVTRSRAPSSPVQTSTAPSVTCMEEPLPSTVIEKLVPFTTAARVGVRTPKWGSGCLPILKTALPQSWTIWITDRSSEGFGTFTRLLGRTVTNSRSRTMTAEPLAPVSIAPPAAIFAPRRAGLSPFSSRIATRPSVSLTVHATCAWTLVLASKRAREAVFKNFRVDKMGLQ
ncbi:iff5 gpi-anchored protein [Qipengyuania citrea LAMA 915]|uniref:Iff5 gpi-anchored protein n=1 Tax=Qipengyuania citrea LAMA 915 TaxID=1306953 RepID=A0A0L1KCZ7_9SPHN|nr:iff5 gpi-anchored protein [Qipengyuania citrea LAMA 915]